MCRQLLGNYLPPCKFNSNWIVTLPLVWSLACNTTASVSLDVWQFHLPPLKLHTFSHHQRDFTAVDSFSAFPFMESQSLGNPKIELPLYIAAAEDVNPNYEALEFWKMHETSLPAWAAAAKRLFLFSHHLLHANGCFHPLNNSFNAHQDSSLQDYIETSKMMQYNSR